MSPIIENSIGLDGKVFAERRSETRHRVFKGGRLTFNKGYGALECVVRNLSDRGARLALGETTAVPNAFLLEIAGESAPRSARLRWRSPVAVGVEFDDRV
ncbi:MAG TPA: PilZ domain-containing protein [Rhizobiales bacterium]|nr:PilZ domain-containing protein [Hyphomicrobiales bacterium]